MDSKLLILGGLIGIVMSGCQLLPDAVSIKPTTQNGPMDIGHGQEVWINVLDERDNKVLGNRDVLGMGGKVTIAGDLTSSIRNAVADGLKNLGFKVVDSRGPQSHELRIAINGLIYHVNMGGFWGKLDTSFTIEGICAPAPSPGYPGYENIYLGEDHEYYEVAPTSGQNEEYINISISQAINKLLQDSKLTGCLVNFK